MRQIRNVDLLPSQGVFHIWQPPSRCLLIGRGRSPAHRPGPKITAVFVQGPGRYAAARSQHFLDRPEASAQTTDPDPPLSSQRFNSDTSLRCGTRPTPPDVRARLREDPGRGRSGPERNFFMCEWRVFIEWYLTFLLKIRKRSTPKLLFLTFSDAFVVTVQACGSVVSDLHQISFSLSENRNQSSGLGLISFTSVIHVVLHVVLYVVLHGA